MKTYDFSRIMTIDDEPVTDEKKKEMTAADMTIRMLRLKDQQDRPTQDQILLSQKIIAKLKKSDIKAIQLKENAVKAIKDAFARWAANIDLCHQMNEIFDGEFTQGQLDDI